MEPWGVEPQTFCVQSRRSTKLSYDPVCGWRDSNPHALRHLILSQAWLPNYNTTAFSQTLRMWTLLDVLTPGDHHDSPFKQHQIMFEICLALKGFFVIGISRTNFQMTTYIIPGMQSSLFIGTNMSKTLVIMIV